MPRRRGWRAERRGVLPTEVTWLPSLNAIQWLSEMARTRYGEFPRPAYPMIHTADTADKLA